MNSTPLKALCLVEWLNDESDSSSESSSEEIIKVHDTERSAKAPSSTISRDVYNQCDTQRADVIVISSGEESSDLDDDEAENGARNAAAKITTPSELLLQDINNNNSNIPPLASTPPRHASLPTDTRLPVELDGILATAIEKLEDNDNESIQTVYQTLAFIEQQEERDRQLKASTLSGIIDQQISPLQRVDSGVDTATTEGEADNMDITLNCRSLEQAELDRSRAAMVTDASSACGEQEEEDVWEERQENMQSELQKSSIQLDEITNEPGNESQALRGVLQKKDKSKTDRIVKLTKMKRLKALIPRSELSGRTRLLNQRSKLAAGGDVQEHAPTSRACDSTVKTKLARRNKQVRRNKVKQNKQKRVAR